MCGVLCPLLWDIGICGVTSTLIRDIGIVTLLLTPL